MTKINPKFHPTKYPGVVFKEVKNPGVLGKDKIYFIRYRLDGKQYVERVGRASTDRVTPAKANAVRTKILMREELPKTIKRAESKMAKTLEQIFERYLKTKESEGKDLIQDMNKFKNWVPSNLKRKAPEELTPQDLKSIWMDMADKGKADQTIVHVLSLIGRVINWGNEMALCPQLSFKIKKPKVNNEVTEMMTEEQLKNYLSALDQAPLDVADQLRLMLYSGLRRTEVFKLEWSHIDFSKRQIKLVSTKSGGDQTIPINKLTEGVLRRQLRGIDTPYVFPKPDGSRYYKRYKEFRAVREAAGLPKTFRPCHGLRHTFASELASSGKVDLYTLQKLLRHSTPVMTQRYAHLRDEALKRGAGVADDMFSDKEESRRERKWT